MSGKMLLRNNEINSATWLISGKIVQMLLSLVVGVVTARYLGPSNYGLINYGTAWVTFFTSLSNLGINSIIVKEFLDHPNECGEALGSTLFLRFISSLFSAIIIIGIICIVDAEEPLTIAVVALCSLGMVFHIFEVINYWFQAQYKSKIPAIASLIAYIGTSIYRIILLVQEKDVRWFALASSIDYIIVAIILLIVYKKNGGPPITYSWTKSKALLRSSCHYILSSLMVAIYAQTDKLMLKQMLNENEVAYYSIATNVCSMWVFVLNAIIDSVYPTILRLHCDSRSAFDRKNRQLYAIVFYLSVCVSTGFLVLGDWVIDLLYGADYAPAGISLKIITWYTAFSYLGVARNAWVVAEGKQKYLKYMYGGAAVLNVGLNYCMIPYWGAPGAAVASLITQVCTSIILPLCISQMRPNVKLMIEAILLKNVFPRKKENSK